MDPTTPPIDPLVGDAVGHPGPHPSLPEVHRSVPIPGPRPGGSGWLRRLFAFSGPAYLVSVGYMDPGNWASDLQGGARFGYQLIWVLLLSNVMAVILQTLAARLGVVTGKDLAQACRDEFPAFLSIPLWILCELAIVACDLAEVLGAAIALQLLFKIPLLWGVLITAFDVLLLLGLARLGIRRMEAFIIVLVAMIGICFGIEILLSKPELAPILAHFIPRDASGAFTLWNRNPAGELSVLGLRGDSLYIAIAIIGATVMPHNLYLHSSLVQTRAVGSSFEGKRQACRMNLVDSAIALNCAFFVNAAILILSAAVFHTGGHTGVSRLEEAHELLQPLLGSALAPVLFAVALLCSGQSSTITGTLAGQIVMEGFLRVRIRPWLRRLISRSLAIVPAVLVIGFRGDQAVDDLLILSQVVLSLQLSFAVIPLIAFTSDRSKMGKFVNPVWVTAIASLCAILIVALNLKLAGEQIQIWWGMLEGYQVARFAIILAAAALVALLAVVTFAGARRSFLARAATGAEPALPPPLPALPVLPAPESVEVEPGYRRIAVALELGPADGAILRFVLPMVRPEETEVVLIHVAESAAGRYLGDQSLDQESREDERHLEALAEELRQRGLRVRALLGHGDAKEELARLVADSGADLLVTGSHGHRLIGDILHGATASGVRHLVRVPVLSVPSPEKPAE